MKLNLLRNSNKVMSGHLNVDILPGEGKVQGDIANLDPLVDNASCTDIVARNVLEYVPHNELVSVLNHWISKLRHGGKLTINTTDLRSIAKAVVRDALEPSDYLNLLYGQQRNAFDIKRSILTASTLSALLESANLKIVNKAMDAYEFSITAERP